MGRGVFQNDAASDWIYDLEQSHDFSVIRSKIYGRRATSSLSRSRL